MIATDIDPRSARRVEKAARRAETLAFNDSKHAKLTQVAADGRPSLGAVTCATCHMPRVTVSDDGVTRVAASHDNTHFSHPRSRMAKTVCIGCHGLDVTFSSIFDDTVVASNFGRRPADHHPTVAMIDVLVAKDERKGTRP